MLQAPTQRGKSKQEASCWFQAAFEDGGHKRMAESLKRTVQDFARHELLRSQAKGEDSDEKGCLFVPGSPGRRPRSMTDTDAKGSRQAVGSVTSAKGLGQEHTGAGPGGRVVPPERGKAGRGDRGRWVGRGAGEVGRGHHTAHASGPGHL